MPTTIFDAYYKNAFTISGSPALVATSTGVGFALSSRQATSPLFYFEAKISTLTGTVAVGVANNGIAIGATILGGTAFGCSYESNGAVVIAGTTVTTLATYAAGAVVGVAVNMQLGLIWFTLNGSTWNNDTNANQNPVGNIGGISLATMTGGGKGLRAGIGASATGAVWNGQFSSGSLSYSVPSAYSTLDVQGPATARGMLKHNFKSSARTASSVKITGNKYHNAAMISYGTPKTISGTVSENGSVVASRIVRVYDSASGAFIGTTKTASDGSFSLKVPPRLVDVVAKDPTSFQAIIFDRVTPA